MSNTTARCFIMKTPTAGESGDSMTTSFTQKLQPLNRFQDMNNLKNYEVIRKLGQGTFGVVQKAINSKTKEVVAIKQLINHSAKEGFPITAMREITILKTLSHTNILKIIEMIYEEPKARNPQDVITLRGCFYTVSPYMSADLVGLLENPRINLSVPQIKCIMKQLLTGVLFIHSQNFLHRDIKAANILIDFKGVVKIADFGLARLYHGQPPRLGQGPGGGERNYTALVVTRWYRPPELLLGERKYTTAVDMWGVGCVFAELFTEKPILVGKSDAHQAQIIFELIGPPNKLVWPTAYTLPNKADFNIGLTCKRTLESRFESILSKDGTELLSNLLTLDPMQRFNALDALAHPYFSNDPIPLEPKDLPKFEESHEIDKERFKKLKEGEHPKNGAPAAPKAYPKSRDSYDGRSRGSRDASHTNYRTNERPNSDFQYAPPSRPSASSIRYLELPANATKYLSFAASRPQTSVSNINVTADAHSNAYQERNSHSAKSEPAATISRRVLNLPEKPKTYGALRSPSDVKKTSAAPMSASSSSRFSPGPKSAISAKLSGVFMTASRIKPRPNVHTRKVEGLSVGDKKRRKLVDRDVNESDLTDFDEDVPDESKLGGFLDWERYEKSPDYEKMAKEKETFENGKK